MYWIKSNWFKLSIVTLSLFITFSVVFYFVISPLHKNQQSISQSSSDEKSEEKLSQRFKEYYDKLEVGLCKEAYDMHSTGSKERLPYDNFVVHCEITQKWERDFKIDKIVHSNDAKVDMRFTYNQIGIDKNNKQFQECQASPYSTWESCSSNASKKLEGEKEDIATWLYENGQWFRDF